MLAITGQMAGPKVRTFFEGTLEYPGGNIGLKKHGQRRPLQLVINKSNKTACKKCVVNKSKIAQLLEIVRSYILTRSRRGWAHVN